MFTKSICLALFTFLTAAAHAGSPSTCALPADVQQKINAAVDAMRASDKISGATYAVYTDSCFLALGEAGSSTPAGGKISADETIFRQASISKLFADIAISQLIEKGELKRDQALTEVNGPIFDYIRKNESPARLDQWGKVTIGHLMSHQAGISKDLPKALVFFNTEALKNNSYPVMQDLYAGILDTEFLFTPGQTNGIKYSNLAVNLLARVVEGTNSKGLKFSDYVLKNVSARAGFKVYYDIPEAKRANMIQSYGSLLKDGTRTAVPPAYFVGAYDGSIGIAGTAHEMGKFGMELLKLMRNESVWLHDDKVISEFFAPKSRVSPIQAWASGPSWMVMPGETANDPLWVGHTGTGAGERLITLVSPERGIGVTVMLNTFDASREKYVKLIADMASTAKRTLTPVEAQRISAARAFLLATPAPVPQIPISKVDPAELQKFVGVYFADVTGEKPAMLSADGYLTFFGEKLEVEDLKKGEFRLPLIEGANSINWNREPVRFEFDSSGKVTGARVANVGKFAKIQ